VNGASFTGNSSLYGGGIYNRSKGSATVTGSAFTRNSAAKRAGAIFNGRSDVLAVTGSGFYQNQAKYGGGIYNRDESTVTDSLIVGNTATSGGGGIYNDGDSTITLTSTSVVGNRPGNCEPVNTIAGCTG
jgi:predicted outer membrane repeat protein